MSLLSWKKNSRRKNERANQDFGTLEQVSGAGNESETDTHNAPDPTKIPGFSAPTNPCTQGFDRTAGPFDASEVDGLGKRINAGSLWLPLVENVQIQFSTDEQKQNILGVVYLTADSALQLQAFAAPKSHGIWDQVRLDMRTSIAKQGGSSKEVDGPFGKELAASMPAAGTQNFAPHRFLGIDGPRWLLRATVYGRAGADPQAALPLLEILRNICVDRGTMPLVPRSLLPLKLPHLPQS